MGKQNDAGVFRLTSGCWAYRYTFVRDGKRISRQGSKDVQGEPLKTKRDAIKARRAALEAEQESIRPAVAKRKTIQAVYQEYCEERAERQGIRDYTEAGQHLAQSS